jgi:O-antigen/teichoic acid export membrane protein
VTGRLAQPIRNQSIADGSRGSAQITQAVRGTALNTLGSVFGATASFVTVGVVTNVYGQAGAGLFFAATAAFTLAANSARLGAESGLMYFVSRFRADDRHGEIPALIRTALAATGAAAVVVGLVGLLLAPALGGLITEDGRSAATATTMLRLLALAVPTYSVGQAIFGATRGFGTMRPAVLIGQIARPLGQLILVLAVAIVTDEVWPLALAWAISSTLSVVSAGAWLRKRLSAVTGRSFSKQHPSSNEVRNEYWRFTAPRALSDLLSASLDRLDVLLVAILIGEVGAGLYGASSRLILAGQLVMVATAQSMAPLLSANFLKGRHFEAQRLLRTVSGWNVTLLWPVFICLAFGSKTALSVFGPEFTEATPVVVVLSLAFLIITGLGMGDTLLTMTGDSVSSLVNHAIALTIMVGSAVVLLPMVGTIGAAWAWALSRVVLRLLAVARVWQTKRVHSFGLPMITAAAVAAVAYVPAGVAGRVLIGESVAAVGTHLALGAAIHLGLLLRFRRRLELDQLLAIVSRR